MEVDTLTEAIRRATIPRPSTSIAFRHSGDVFRWGLIMAGVMLAAVPVMTLYYLAQRLVM